MATNLKWVEERSGKYKLVTLDDPRPEVKLKSRRGTPTIKFTPSWKKYESSIHLLDGADKFNKEREHAVKTDPKAARWEKSRREWFQKQKHAWREKEMAKLKEKGL